MEQNKKVNQTGTPKIILTVTMRLVPADPNLFATGVEGVLKQGVLYFLRSSKTGKMDARPYYTGIHTNIEEFRIWMRLAMVYVPIHPNDAALFGYNEKNKP